MISYFVEQTKFRFINRRACSNWIMSSMQEEGLLIKKRVGDISFIFCSDDFLLDMNKKYLSHDYYTDVITFDNSEEHVFAGDIFVSVDRVRENAELFEQSFIDELNRVMIHGILHLLGYDDATDSQKKIMRSKEDFYLAKRIIK
jgi:probable rRNA maturation factor